MPTFFCFKLMQKPTLEEGTSRISTDRKNNKTRKKMQGLRNRRKTREHLEDLMGVDQGRQNVKVNLPKKIL